MYICMRRQPQSEKSRRLLERARRVRPKNRAHITVGLWMYIRMRRPPQSEKSRRLLERARQSHMLRVTMLKNPCLNRKFMEEII